MNSWVPISGFGVPLACQASDLGLLGGEGVTRVHGARARGFAGSEQLATGALGERLGPEAAEAFVSGSKLVKPLVVHQLGPRRLWMKP